MRKSPVRLLALMLPLFGAVACRIRDSSRVDSTGLQHDAAGPRLRVTILGHPGDPRVPPVREAIAHWNSEFLRLGRRVHLDSGTVRSDSVRDEDLRAVSGEAVLGGGPATNRVLAQLSGVPADIVIALSQTDLISFSIAWQPGSRGIVGVRRSDIPPLTLPNTVRNVVAHELGHVLGLQHNTDSTMLMCGRPASCRPAAFASDRAHFFPLTASDDQWLQKRWP